MTNWRQLELQLNPRQRTFDPSWALWGSPGPSWAQPEPILRAQCGTLKMCIFAAISNVIWL